MKDKRVSQKLVHKHDRVNVHIMNLRRILPKRIEAGVFEAALEKHRWQNRDLLTKLYTKTIPDKHYEGSTEPFYLLRSIPYRVDPQRASDLIRSSHMGEENCDFLRSFYEMDEKGEAYVLYRIPDFEIEEIKVLQLLQMKDLQIKDPEKAALSELLEEEEALEKRNVFYANLYMDSNHPYFFEHPNEHIPGMMLIEATRQLMVACTHKYGNIPLRGMNFILSGLCAEFVQYIELNYPTRFRVEFDSLSVNSKGQWTQYDSTVTILQRNVEAAVVKFEAKVISDKLFEKIRVGSVDGPKAPRFTILPEYKHDITLTRADGASFPARLLEISRQGFMLELECDTENTEDETLDFSLTLEEHEPISGQCQMRWIDQESYDCVAGFEITELGKAEQRILQDAMKRYAFVKEIREIV